MIKIPVSKTFPLKRTARTLLFSLAAALLLSGCASTTPPAKDQSGKGILLHAARVFDGNEIKTGTSVLIEDGKVVKVDAREAFKNSAAKVIELGDATLLPGFIELHAHLTYRGVPADTVLKHGVTTIRDLGGPVHKPYGGKGQLRVLTAGLTLTSENGYPITKMGAANLAIPVSSEEQARESVRKLVAEGAVIIKVALEPGGEKGAPWAGSHGHAPHAGKHHSGHNDHTGHAAEHHHDDSHSQENHHDHAGHDHDDAHHHEQKQASSHHGTEHAGHHANAAAEPWPLLSEAIVKAIVDEAHKHQRKVTAHIGEEKGAEIAINAGVGEWAHIPCAKIPKALLQKAAAQQVKVVGTFDTLSKCEGVFHNAHVLSGHGVEFLYGSEIAHPDIPWGIDGQELMYMRQYAKMKPLEILKAATSKAGQHLGIPLLGTLQKDAPADIIAVRGNPLQSLKSLEYPGLVISGGKVIVNDFGKAQ